MQGWETGNVGQTPTSTKSVQPQASEPAKEVVKVPDEPTCKSESQLESVPTLVVNKDLQPTPTEEEDDIAAVARMILTENPNIA